MVYNKNRRACVCGHRMSHHGKEGSHKRSYYIGCGAPDCGCEKYQEEPLPARPARSEGRDAVLEFRCECGRRWIVMTPP